MQLVFRGNEQRTTQQQAIIHVSRQGQPSQTAMTSRAATHNSYIMVVSATTTTRTNNNNEPLAATTIDIRDNVNYDEDLPPAYDKI
jgi:hypothetical protein